ncbi:hypothetical protein Mal52_39680 [Symmachiella dynata]|uniref:Uncharacterized protein n=1 Tax=Symmachiella dynata TaxID=2527995 RepID=A0A517ZSP5_9PLAN|nr:hypothetical protein Mal52_39680 [Symmachiella dynata]
MGSGIFKLCQFNRSCDERVFWRIVYENARAVYCRLKNRRVAMFALIKTKGKTTRFCRWIPIIKGLPPVGQDR